MALGNEKIQQIEAVVSDLLREIEYDQDNSFIVDIQKLAEKYGIVITESEFDDPEISGAYVSSEKKIIVAAKDPYFRKLFSIAHELGHYFLGHDIENEILYRKPKNSDDETEHAQREQEANWFAASILMPQKDLKKVWKYLKDIEQVAEIFSVSTVAAQWRIRNLETMGVL